MEMPDGWKALNEASDTRIVLDPTDPENGDISVRGLLLEFAKHADLDKACKLMKEMAEALEIFDNEYIPGSAKAHEILKKFKEWK